MTTLRFIKTNGTIVDVPCEEVTIEPGLVVFGISKNGRRKAGKAAMIISPYGNCAFAYGEFENTLWYA